MQSVDIRDGVEYGTSFGLEDFTMPLLFVLPELFMPQLSIPPGTSGAPPSLAPTEPLAPILWEWLGQTWQRGWGESGEGRGVSF